VADITVRKDIVVRFITDMKKAKKDAQIYENQVSRVGAASGKAGGAVKGMGASGGMAMSGLAGAGGAALSTVGPLALVVAGAYGLKKGFEAVFDAGKNAETALVKLSVMFKSEAKAMEIYQAALERSVETPLDPKDIVEAAVLAQGYLGKAGDVFTKGLYGMKKDVMTTIADMTAFVGKGYTAEQATKALLRGQLDLLDPFGADAKRVYTQAKKKGALGSAAFIEAFVKGMSEVDVWKGMSKKSSEGVEGLMSTIVGYIGLIPLYISGAVSGQGKGMWEKLKDGIEEFSSWLGKSVQKAKPYLEQFGAYVGDVFVTFKNLFVEVWGLVFPIIKGFFGLFFTYWKLAWTTVVKPTIKIITFGLKLLKTFFSFLFNMGGAGSDMKRIMTWIENFTGHMSTVFFLTDKLFDKMLGTFDKWLKDFNSGLDDALTAIMQILGLIPDTILPEGTTSQLVEAQRFRELKKTMGGEGARQKVFKERQESEKLKQDIELELRKSPLPVPEDWKNIRNKQSSNVSTDNRKYATNDSSKRNSHNVIYNYNYFSDINMQDVLDQSGIAS